MKNSIFTLTLFLFIGCTKAQEINKIVEYKPNKFMLLGKVNKDGFTHKDFSWFKKNYNAYLTNTKVVEKLKADLKNYKIKAFFGSWCGDSKKNLPPFYKVLEEANFNLNNLEVIAVDRKKEAYKQSPNGEEKGLNIHRVPTFIFYKDGKEVNRIVEHPQETLERDILKIVSKKKYEPRYKAVSYLENLFIEKSMDSIKLMEKQLIGYLAELSKGTYELNTYGNVKRFAKEPEKAQFIFELNAKMRPQNYYAKKTLGDFYFDQKEYYKSLENYYKSLSIQPDNKTIKDRIVEIEALLK